MRSINALSNAMRQQAEISAGTKALPRMGLVSSYDPNKHSAKILWQPDGIESDWMPVGAVGVGAGFGVLCAPNLGDMVLVEFSEGSSNAPKIVGRYFSNINVPPSVPSGETWIVHKSGSVLKFHNSGVVELVTAADLNATVGGNLNATVSGAASYTASSHTFTGPVTMKATLNVAQAITGQGGMAISGGSGAAVTGNLNVTNGNVSADGIDLKTHTHSDPQGGFVGAPQG